jgi:hypothetical protein
VAIKPTLNSIGGATVAVDEKTELANAPSFDSIKTKTYDFGIVERDKRIKQFIATTPDLDENSRAKLINSAYIADTYKVDFDVAFQNHDGVISDLFGNSATAKSVLKTIQDSTKTNEEKFNEYDDGYYNKARSTGKSVVASGFVAAWEKIKDRYNRMGIGMATNFIGLVEATGDITSSETLQQWSNDMRLGVRTYMKENPHEFLNPGGGGFWDTTQAYISNPEYIALGVMEQTPNIALAYVGGLAGKAIAGAAGAGTAVTAKAKWIGGVEGFAIPSFGRRYSDLRGDGISPITALPEAFIGSQVEGLLEEWTLGKKIRIFKNAGKNVQRAMSTKVSQTLLGGAKTYGRGAFEEGTQQISDNFWAMLFRDVDVGLLNDVGNQAAVGGLLEMAMSGGFHAAGSYSKLVDKKEKLQRVETFREKINKIPMNQTHKDEINTEIDAVKESIEKESILFDSQDVAVQKLKDTDVISPGGVDTKKEIERTPRFGMVEGVDGDWQVIDYETQKEVGTKGGSRFVADQMNKFNKGDMLVEADRKTPLLPSETATFNVRQMLNHVLKGMSKAARTGYIQGAKDAIKGTTNLSKFAISIMNKLDIPKGQRKTLMNAISRPRTPAEQTVAMATIQRIADIALHTKAVNELKKTVTYINRHTGRARTQGGIAPDYLEKLKAYTDTFILTKLSKKKERRVRGLVTYLEGLKEGESSAFSKDYAESRIPKELLTKIEQLGLRSITDMTLQEIRDMNKTLSMLIHLNNTKNAIINKRTGERVSDILSSALDEVNNLKDRSTLVNKNTVDMTDKPDSPTNAATWLQGTSKSILNFFAGNKNHNIETLNETISGGVHGASFDVLSNGLSDGRETQADFISQWNDIRDSFMKELTIDELQDMSTLFFQILKNKVARDIAGNTFGLKNTRTYDTFKSRDGKIIKMTMADMMSVYMMTENMDTVNEMIKAGVANPKQRLGSITIEDIKNIRKKVESDVKAMNLIAMAKAIKKFEAQKINETSRKLDGIDIVDISDYWHRERFTGGGVAGKQTYKNSLLESGGWLKEREGSEKPVIIRDFFESMVLDQQFISEYVGMAQPLRDVKNLLNFKEYRDTLQTKGYGEELKLIDTMVKRTEQKPHEFSVTDNVISMLTRGLVRSILANPGIMAGQIASIVPVLENEMSLKYAGSVSLLLDKDSVNRYKANWKMYKQRIEGNISSIALKEAGKTGVVLQAFTGKTEFINFLLKGIHYVDSVAITTIGKAIEVEMADMDMSGVSSEYWLNAGVDLSSIEKDSVEYWQLFRERANYVLRRTQPMFFQESRSVLTSETSATTKSLFLFRSYIDQPLRMAYRTVNNYSNGKINAVTASKQLASVWAGLAVYEVIRAAIRKGLFRSDEDEKDLILSILAAPVKVLNIIGRLAANILTELVDFAMTGNAIDIRANDLSPLPLQFANDLLKHVGEISKGLGFAGSNERFKSGKNKNELKSEVHLREGITGIFSDTLKYFGVPVNQIKLLLEDKKTKKKGVL